MSVKIRSCFYYIWSFYGFPIAGKW